MIEHEQGSTRGSLGGAAQGVKGKRKPGRCCLREYLELNTIIIKNMDKTELVDLMLKDIEKMTKANEDALQYHNVRTILNYGDYNFDDYAKTMTIDIKTLHIGSHVEYDGRSKC